MSDEQSQLDDAKMPRKANGEGRQSNNSNKQWHPFLRERDIYNQTISSRFFDVCDDAINTAKSMIAHDESGLLARRLAVGARILTALACVAALIGIGITGWNMGGRSVVVQESPQYRKEAENLKWANSDLEESKQDVNNRQRQLREAGSQVDQLKRDQEKYGQLIQEIKQAQQQSETPVLTVTVIGDILQRSTFSYHVPITVHNNSQSALTFFEVYYQAVDGAGNVVDAGYAVGSSGTTCEPNADCEVTTYSNYSPAGTRIVPTFWSTNTASSDSQFGRYGADVVSRQF
ncbi:hypothetical protein BLI708_09390 [Bifidobacterium imperatoris]|uniref:Uncharacterized protein n=1 Tax=Bifidobacterium imperatoris TaxID=2020965 RepID=A0A2N5IRR5_9BIFI|nr:hypothetical protein [Bifidobacterium imperatoris]PLS24640.1 hypothetical protein Tam1G_1228 [Bifidobacterium imperatoris]QSY57432.1 hypothetical protein BLI708_09390 [Bifidobacterium imperatoris]